MTKVSIIIPYHNVESYIEQCLKSVTGQTLADIEIICVNDASTDKSQEIVESFNDPRIKMLSTEKLSGQAHARNLALDVVQGEYIGFVDADDWVEAEMFEKLYLKAKFQNADITMCGAKLYDDETSEIIQNDYYSLKPLERFAENAFCATDTKDEILNINVVIWNKIYRRDFLLCSGERFADGFIYEDLPFFFGTYLKAQKVNIVWEDLYFYRQNRESSTMQNIDKKVYDRIPMVSLAYTKLKEAPFYKEKQIEILSWIIDDIFHRYSLLDEKYYKEYFYMMKKLYSSFELTDEEKSKLDTCYCYDEFCNILKNNYFDFWKFLIEKYKTSNKLIKTIKHENNESMAKIKEYWEKYKIQKEEEIAIALTAQKQQYENDMTNLCGEYEQKLEDQKTQISGWYENVIFEKQNDFERAYQKLTDDFKCQITDIEQNHSNEVTKLHEDFNYRMVKQESELKKWQAQSVKEKEQSLVNSYEYKLQQQKNLYLEALTKQKEYYENNFLLVKINIKFNKFMSQLKNKIKKFLKKN